MSHVLEVRSCGQLHFYNDCKYVLQDHDQVLKIYNPDAQEGKRIRALYNDWEYVRQVDLLSPDKPDVTESTQGE